MYSSAEESMNSEDFRIGKISTDVSWCVTVKPTEIDNTFKTKELEMSKWDFSEEWYLLYWNQLSFDNFEVLAAIVCSASYSC